MVNDVELWVSNTTDLGVEHMVNTAGGVQHTGVSMVYPKLLVRIWGYDG